MNPKHDYVPFWVYGESNRLERCASIYGCQGFESDFVGVIWGRDFIWKDNCWQIGNYCEDEIGKPSLKKLIYSAKKGNKTDYQKAMQLLINRYRIFLTRGIKGTYIFCEDSKTKSFLHQIFDKLF